MKSSLTQQIRENLSQKSTEELGEIWVQQDTGEWSPQAFQAIRQILIERGVNPDSLEGRKKAAAGAVEGTATRPVQARPVTNASQHNPPVGYFDRVFFVWLGFMRRWFWLGFIYMVYRLVTDKDVTGDGALLVLLLGILGFGVVALGFALLYAPVLHDELRKATCPKCSTEILVRPSADRAKTDEGGESRIQCPSCQWVLVFDAESFLLKRAEDNAAATDRGHECDGSGTAGKAA